MQDADQEERVQVMPRRKQRQLSQKVRFESQTDEAAVEAVAPQVEPVQSTELAKVDLPAVIENAPEQEETTEAVTMRVCRVAHVAPRVICA